MQPRCRSLLLLWLTPLQEGPHWEHPDNEVAKKREELMATMEQIDANLGIEQNKVFTDRDFGFKEAELQEQWRSRRQLDQVPVLP